MARTPSFLANLLMQSSDSPYMRRRIGLAQNDIANYTTGTNHATDGSTDSIGFVGGKSNACFLIYVSDVNLDGGMILGVNNSVAGRAKE